MLDENGDIVDEEVKEEIDYVSIGKAMKKFRRAKEKTQQQAAEKIGTDRTVYTKYETGVLKPSKEVLKKFSEAFEINLEELYKKVSVVIPDTSALLKNKRLLHMLLEDYEQVIIPSTVMMELSYRKTQKNTPEERKTAKVAWQVMANIDYYMVEYGEGKEESNGKEDDESDEVSNDNGESKKKNKEKARIIKIDNDKYKVPDSIPNVRNMINDHKVMAMAKDLEKKVVGDVIIIHDDVDFADYDGKGKAVRIDDYIAKRSRLIDYNSITDLDMEFDHLEEFKRIIKRLDLNAYMADGMTLLISAIRCNDIEKIKERNGRRIPDPKVSRKVRFLIDSGVDLNKNDNGRYCLPPLSHCIQIDNFDIFNMLLEEGCDFNKASRDETTASYMKVGKLNEGNTPLMIACYHARKKYVYKLCEKEGISLNQQDSNGYTALIKCAVQRYNRIKRGQKVSANEELYNYLISKGADTLIRDRNNHTAKDWFKRGDDMSYKENEQW